ncbi:GNAT family N-acetyltransferase [Alteromonas sp. CYL-A6]|uniref:GNAT family N-acetyltransferase n=1 Tax=Alteromonas nitratireducens TaxID=3390813 RepID=UPI0034B384BE
MEDKHADGITFRINAPVATSTFIQLLYSSTLAERRPVEDRACIDSMLTNSNLVVSAWQGDELVGIARSVTDFHYACYLSDLAVASSQQKGGIGRKLLALTQQQLGPHCKLILISAPDANRYYPALGFTHNDRCWVMNPEQVIAAEKPA